MSQGQSMPVTTRLSSSVYRRTRSEDMSRYHRGASSALKTRTENYKRNLVRSRGLTSPLFDDQLIKLVLKYSKCTEEIKEELKYLDQLVDPQGYRFSRNLKIYSGIENQIEGFMSDDHVNFFWNQNYKLALKQVQQDLRFNGLRALKYHCDDDISSVLPKASTHSGFTYLLSGKRCKGDNVRGLKRKLSKHLEDAAEVRMFSIPNLIAFRTQASGEYDVQGRQTHTCKHKTRMVTMVDLTVIANELQFTHPFMSRFKDVQSFAGGKNDAQISSIISGLRGRYKYFMSLDYSLFDQSISGWLIRDAFHIVESCFDFDEDDKFKFECVVNDFVTKDFFIDEGLVRSKRGIPSGSMFTQIIGSIVNQIVIRTYLNSVGLKGEMIVMGDDNLVYTNELIDLNVLSSYVKHNFGLVINPSKSTYGKSSDNPEFLSRIWTAIGPTKSWKLVLSRMAYPERFRVYNDDVQPHLVLYAYYLTYRSVSEIVDIGKFLSDYGLNKSEVRNVDSRYIPGALAYIREYELD